MTASQARSDVWPLSTVDAAPSLGRVWSRGFRDGVVESAGRGAFCAAAPSAPSAVAGSWVLDLASAHDVLVDSERALEDLKTRGVVGVRNVPAKCRSCVHREGGAAVLGSLTMMRCGMMDEGVPEKLPVRMPSGTRRRYTNKSRPPPQSVGPCDSSGTQGTTNPRTHAPSGGTEAATARGTALVNRKPTQAIAARAV